MMLSIFLLRNEEVSAESDGHDICIIDGREEKVVRFRWDSWKGFRFSLNIFQGPASGPAKGPW